MKRACTLCVLSLVGIVVVACDSGIDPPLPRAGVDFALSSGGSHSAAGAPATSGDGSILHHEFAVAKADSVGGFAVLSFDPSANDPNQGNLFVLQAPRQTGTIACAEFGAPCHGRYITGVRDGQTIGFDKWFTVTEGRITVTMLGPDRLRGMFSIVLEAEDGEQIVVQNGTIDVPYSADPVTDGALRCLIGLSGAGSGGCRG